MNKGILKIKGEIINKSFKTFILTVAIPAVENSLMSSITFPLANTRNAISNLVTKSIKFWVKNVNTFTFRYQIVQEIGPRNCETSIWNY